MKNILLMFGIAAIASCFYVSDVSAASCPNYTGRYSCEQEDGGLHCSGGGGCVQCYWVFIYGGNNLPTGGYCSSSPQDPGTNNGCGYGSNTSGGKTYKTTTTTKSISN